MIKIRLNIGALAVSIMLLLSSCGNNTQDKKASDTEKTTTTVLDGMAMAEDYQYMGYRVVHHITAVVKHLEKFGFNKFDHPKIADHNSFVITPALDHFYSKAVVDLREGPVVITTASKDDRYSSIQIFDMEHHTKYDKVTSAEGEAFVLVRDDYKGELPKGTVIKMNCSYPFVFLRTQSFNFNDDKKADEIRRKATISGKIGELDLPNLEDTQAIVKWVQDNETSYYTETKAAMDESIKNYTSEFHKATFEHLLKYLASGALSGNPGMFEDVDDPVGGTFKIRAAGVIIGHLGFPVHHAYYQNVAVFRDGTPLNGKKDFSFTLPHHPDIKLFWSVTRYAARNRLPLDPTIIGGNDIQAYNAFNTEADKEGNVTFTFSKEDPKNGSYWMPITEDGYYFVVRYYGPNPGLIGQSAFDLIYKGTELESKLKCPETLGK